MYLVLQVASVFLASVAMALSLAHALELPGKLRLDRQTYCAMQPIYYPGFTVGGGLGEGLGMIVILVLLLMTPTASAAFPWFLVGFLGLVATHAAYWILTHPVNNFWLKDQELERLAGGFFKFDPFGRRGDENAGADDLWTRLRDRWEYSHVLRAVLSAIGLIALIIGLAVG